MIGRGIIASVLVGLLFVVGCAAAPAEKPAPAPTVGGVGGDMGAATSADSGMVQGVVAAAEQAILEAGESSRVTSEGVVLARVVAPADGWVVVNSTVAPGRPLGMAWVPEGESRNVTTYTDETTVDGTEYAYRIVAKNQAGEVISPEVTVAP